MKIINRKSFFKSLAGLSAGILIAKIIPIKEPENPFAIDPPPHCGEIEKIYISQSKEITGMSMHGNDTMAYWVPIKRDELAYIINKKTGEKLYL